MFRAVKLAAAVAVLAVPAWADRLPGARSLSVTDWGYTIVGSPSRAGPHAQRFEVRSGDCASNGGWDDCARDRERSEFRPDLEWDSGDPMWLGFSVFLPSDFAVSNHVKTTIAQIHQRGGPIRVAGAQVSRPPVMQMELRGTTLRLTVHVPGAANIHVTLAQIDEMRGAWTDFRVEFVSGDDLAMRVWVNDILRADVRDWPTPPPEFFYFKYGIYRSFVSRHGGPMPTQVLYIDEVRLGPSSSSVAVDPDRPVD